MTLVLHSSCVTKKRKGDITGGQESPRTDPRVDIVCK